MECALKKGKFNFIGILFLMLGFLSPMALGQAVMPTPAKDLKNPQLIILHGDIATPILVPPDNKVPENLREFGFYHSGLFNSEDIQEVASFSTFVDVIYDRVDLMDVARDRGLKLWVTLSPIFFTHPDAKKRPDYMERWESAKAILKQFEDIIYAFDPLDEPFDRSEMSHEELKLYLEEIASLLEADFPNARRSLTFAKNTVERFRRNYLCFQVITIPCFEGYPDPYPYPYPYPYPLPEGWNFLSADNYRGAHFAYATMETLMDVTEFLDVNYYLIPQAFQSDAPRWALLSEDQLIIKARQAYDFAALYPRVETLRPFMWRSFFENGYFYAGIEDLPKVRGEYEKIGKVISLFR